MTRSSRRRPLLFAGVAVVLFLVVGAWLGGTAYLARAHLLDVRSEVSRLQDDVSAGRTDRLPPGLAAVRRDAQAARRLTSDPVWWLASHVPVLGHTFDASSGLARATDQLAGGALPQLVDAATQLDPAKVRKKDGSIELARLTAAEAPLMRADAQLADARRTVAGLPATGLVAPVATARRQLDTQLGGLAGSLDAATRAARIGPAMLGANGTRRYLVMFQNPAEARGTGGLTGSFAVIRAERGKITRERTGSDAELQDAPEAVVDLGPEYRARWHAADADRGWRNANFTPHYPWAAEVWQKLWERQSGQKVDGVLAVDPVALGYLLKVTGPITLSDGERLTGDTVARWTMSTEYFRYATDNDTRKRLLTELAEKAFDRFTSGDGGSAGLLKALGRSAGEGRVLLWSTRPDEERSVLGTPLAGTALDARGPFASLVLNNGGGNKLDYYVDRAMGYEVLSCGPTRRTRATIRLTNTAPASGLPSYVVVRSDGRTTQPPGQSRTFVSYYATAGATVTGATLDGKPIRVVIGVERGRPVVQADVQIDPGKTRTMVVELTEPPSTSGVTVPVQPLARPMRVELGATCR